MNKFLFSIFILISIGQNIWAEETAEQALAAQNKIEKATFAGGCFWCMETPFEKLKGVQEVISGFTGGSKLNPTYREVSAGGTGHCESVEVVYDPEQITYEQLLDVFWHNIDPTDPQGQFVDKGDQYRSAIFYHNEEQKRLAQDSKKKLEASGKFTKPIVTEITQASDFYPAENYHQNFYKTHPYQYKFYRFNSGRDRFLDKVWGKDRIH